MASPSDRFTRLEKIAVFLIAMGEARSREILADFDLATIEQINDTIGFLVDITPQEKAAVMIEFGDFFYKNKPLSSKLYPPVKTKSKPGVAGKKPLLQPLPRVKSSRQQYRAKRRYRLLKKPLQSKRPQMH